MDIKDSYKKFLIKVQRNVLWPLIRPAPVLGIFGDNYMIISFHDAKGKMFFDLSLSVGFRKTVVL